MDKAPEETRGSMTFQRLSERKSAARINLKRTQNSIGRIATYTFDESLNLMRVIQLDASRTTFVYSSSHLLTSQIGSQEQRTSYAHDKLSLEFSERMRDARDRRVGTHDCQLHARAWTIRPIVKRGLRRYGLLSSLRCPRFDNDADKRRGAFNR